MDAPLVLPLESKIELVVPHEETPYQGTLLLFLPLARRLQQQGAQGGRERQGIEAGYDDGHGQREGELAVEDAHRPVHEAHGHEHGRHDQRDGNDGAANLADGRHRCLVGRHLVAMYLDMDGFHHHDGIVHHDADGQHQGKEREHVDGKAHHLHEEEGTYQRHRHGNGRNQRGAEILQEDVHHHKHQQEGFEEGLEHRLDGGVEETGHVVGDVIVHARRKAALLDFLHALLDVLDDLAGIGAGTLLDHDGGRGTAVRHGYHVVVLRVELNVGHILQAQQGTVRHGLQHYLAILFRSAELAGVLQHVLHLLGQLVRADAGLSRRRFDVLPADGIRHVLGHHVVGRQAGGIQPDTHGVIAAAHDFHQAHAVDALQFAQDVDVGKVIDELLGMGAVRTEHVEIHQHAVHFLFRHHAGADDFFGQLVEHGGHTVLHVHGGHVRVSAHLEVNRGERHAVVGADGGHIGHAGHAVDGTLQRGGHGLRHDVGTGTRIAGRDRHGRRHDVRELRDGQRRDGECPEADDDDGQHSRKYRPSDKQLEHGTAYFFRLSSFISSRISWAEMVSVFIFMPSFNVCTPS